MKTGNRLMLLLAAGMFTLTGFLNMGRAEDLGITILYFLAAGLFLFSYFGKSKFSCGLSGINKSSEEIVLREGHRKKNRWNALQIGLLTFSVILLCFSVGFGMGRAIYHIIN